MHIVSMRALSGAQRAAAAQLLSDSLPEGWPTPADAWAEIENRLAAPENELLAAMSGGEVLGWGGIIEPAYDGNVMELHPLAVRGDRRGAGIGRAIVLALEAAARSRGVLTLWLGADDDREGGETSLAGADLFDDLPGKLQTFEAGTHQTGFYLKLGYRIIGVMPDANGPGRPDIFMAKRLPEE